MYFVIVIVVLTCMLVLLHYTKQNGNAYNMIFLSRSPFIANILIVIRSKR